MAVASRQSVTITDDTIYLTPPEPSTVSHGTVDPASEMDTSVSLIENVRRAMSKFGSESFLGHRAGLYTCAKCIENKYTYMTYDEADAYITELAKVLQGMGVAEGDKIAIYAKNSPLWLLTFYAAAALGAVTIPLYDTLGPVKIAYCLCDAEVKVLFTQVGMLPNILGAIHLCPTVQRIVVLDLAAGSPEGIDIHGLVRKAVPIYADCESKNDAAIAELSASPHDDAKSAYTFSVAMNGASPASPDSPRSAAPSSASLRAAQAAQAEGKDVFNSVVDVILGNIGLDADGASGTAEPVEDGHPGDALTLGNTDGRRVGARSSLLFLSRLLKEAKDRPYGGDRNPPPDAPVTIVYTSGTSGNPKGVVHTSRTLMGTYCIGWKFMPYRVSPTTGNIMTTLSYLPLGHIYELANEVYSTTRGQRIAYYAGDTRGIAKDIVLAQPTILYTVPRVTQKIYNSVLAKLDRSRFKRALFYGFMALKERCERYWVRTGFFPLTDNGVFKPIRQAFGGRLEYLMSASAALPAGVWRFLRLCTGARVSCGYGSTETCCTGFTVLPHCPVQPGSLGRLEPFMEAKIIDRSDASEFSVRRDLTGELLVKGPGIALEYHRRPDLALRDADGFYHTEDIVRYNLDDGSVTFVRRVNLVVKSLMGEFIDLVAVEDALETSPLVVAAYVHAQSDKAFPVCVCVLDKTILRHRLGELAKKEHAKRDSPASDAEAKPRGRGQSRSKSKGAADDADVDTPEARAQIRAVLAKEADAYVKKNGLKGHCVPRVFTWLFDVDWSTDTELMTPSMKKQHRFFAQRYAAEITAMWAELDALERQAGAK